MRPMVEFRKSCTKACNSLGTFPLELRNALWNVSHWHDSCGFHRRAVVDLPITCSENVLWKLWIFDWKSKSLWAAGGWCWARAAGRARLAKSRVFYFTVLKIAIKKWFIKKYCLFLLFFAGRRRTTDFAGWRRTTDWPICGFSENGEMDYCNWKI